MGHSTWGPLTYVICAVKTPLCIAAIFHRTDISSIHLHIINFWTSSSFVLRIVEGSVEIINDKSDWLQGANSGG